MSDLSVHSDTVWQLNDLFILQFNMRLITLRPLSEPHHSSLYLSCHTAVSFSLFLQYLCISILLNLKGDKPCIMCYIANSIKCDGCPVINILQKDHLLTTHSCQ